MPPRLARLLAVVGALALVAGAFVLRGALSGDDEVTAGSGDRDPAGDAPFRILCDDDLGDACAALADRAGVGSVEVVRAGEAVTRLTAEELAYDAWLTLDPWPQILAVAGAPDRTPAVTDPLPVASAPLAVLVDPGSSDCAGPTTWACLSRPARPPVGIASLATAVGPLVLAHAAAALQGDTDFGINQLDDDVRIALEGLLENVGSDGGRSVVDQATGMLQPGRFSAVVAPKERAEALAASRQGRGRSLVVASLGPAATLGVVLAGIGPRGPAALDALTAPARGQTVRLALAAAGWTGPAGTTTGLPAPDVVYALQEELS
jgi:hypothetical protein